MNESLIRKKEFSGLKAYANTQLPMYVDGNIYINGANRFDGEKNFLEMNKPVDIMVVKENLVTMKFNFDKTLRKLNTLLITSDILGKASVPDQAFENKDGTPVVIDYDYFGNKRNRKKPVAGPFEIPEEAKIDLYLYPGR